MSPTIGLMMIVKNEAQTLPRLAASLAGQIDRYTIVDTGSTDDTVALIPTLFPDIPGQVIEDEWRGYGESRNVALEAAREHTDWLLTMDADDVLEGRLPRELLDAGHTGFETTYYYDNLRYATLRLIRADAGWTWAGRVHECLQLPEGAAAPTKTTEFRIIHHADGGNRSTKWMRELDLLRAEYAERPDDSRTVFYLARAFDDLNLPAEAANWYRKRLAMGGWEEELWQARWRLGATLIASGHTEEGCGTLWQAWDERPWRVEPLAVLAEHYRMNQRWQLVWEVCQLARRKCGALPPLDGHPTTEHSDRLFVHTEFVQWSIAFEQSIAAWYVGEHAEGKVLVDYVLSRSDLPEQIRSSAETNRRHYEQ